LTWYYQGEKYLDTPEDYQGFVYIITELDTGKRYIGKKNFWQPKTLPITKKRKRRVRTRVESNWKDYFGSNKELQQLVEAKGINAFKREILHLCKSKGECSYRETKEQFDREVLLTDDYYNGIINCRIGANSVKKGFTNLFNLWHKIGAGQWCYRTLTKKGVKKWLKLQHKRRRLLTAQTVPRATLTWGLW